MSLNIHVVPAATDKFFVNAFLIEGDEAVVLVDTHFVTSSTQVVLRRLAEIGKTLAGVVITHPHPDHFNGLPTVLAAYLGTPVYATAATIQGIADSQAVKRIAWTPVYGDDYPKTDALPDHTVAPDGHLQLGGIELEMHDLGSGECSDNTVLFLPQANTLIASDLVYNGCHPWLAKHRTQAWLEQIDLVRARFAGVEAVYAGHGLPGRIGMLDEQRDYITAFHRLVSGHAAQGHLDDAGVAAIVRETTAGRDGWPLAELVELNARAVAEELAQP